MLKEFENHISLILCFAQYFLKTFIAILKHCELKNLPKAWLDSLSKGSNSSSELAMRPDELSLVRWTAHCQIWAVPSPEDVKTSSCNQDETSLMTPLISSPLFP